MSAASNSTATLKLRQQAKLANVELSKALNHKAVHAYAKRFGALVQTKCIGRRFVLKFSTSAAHFPDADTMINYAWGQL